MHSAATRILIASMASLAVIALCFLSASKIVQYVSPQHARANALHVAAATYGDNCRRLAPGSASYRVTAGNATAIAFLACENTEIMCPVAVDLVRLGDPAPGCPKDFSVSWRCGSDSTLHQVHLPGEAAHQFAWIGCPTGR